MKVPKAEQLSSGAWRIRLRLNGKSIPVYGNTERECIRQAEALKASHRIGEYIPTKSSDKTLGQLVDEYIEARRPVRSPATIRGYIVLRKNRFKQQMDTPFGLISNWQAVVNKEIKVCSAKTLKNAWGLISSTLKYAELPVPEVALPSVPPAKKNFLLYDEIELFLEAVKDQPCEIAALLALHSLRRSEVIALDWRSIDLARGRIRVSGAVVPDENNEYVWKQENKNASSNRTVPIMIPRLAELLKKSKKRVGRIVTDDPNTIYSQINALCRKNDLPEVGWHGLRHSFASLAVHLSVPEMVAAQIGGWNDLTTMHKIYTHIAQQDVDSYGDELKKFFQNIGSAEKN